jgi:hypothetical protein
MNTFTADDNTAKRGNPTESSRAYQPYIIGQKSRYNEDERSSSDDDSYGYNRNKKPPPSDDEISEPGYARVGENGKVARDKTDGSRDPSRPNPNSVYAKVDKGNNNNRAMSNGRKYNKQLLNEVQPTICPPSPHLSLPTWLSWITRKKSEFFFS